MDNTDTLTHIVHIDSRDRDYGEFASPNSYRILLPKKYRHVLSARLLGCELPSTFFVFAAALGNTSLAVVDDGVALAITIPDGNYTTSTMCTALAAALSAATGKAFTATLDAATLRLTVTAATGDFSFDTRAVADSRPVEWGLGYFLGLAKGTLTSSVDSSLTPPGVLSVNPYTYILLDVDELNNVETGGIYGKEIGPKTFAKVPLSGASFEYVFTGKDALHQMHLGHVHYRPPLQKLDRLAITFKFHDGRTVDWNGVEHSFSLELVCRIEQAPQLKVSKVLPAAMPPAPTTVYHFPTAPAIAGPAVHHHHHLRDQQWKGKRWLWFLGALGAVIGFVVFKNRLLGVFSG